MKFFAFGNIQNNWTTKKNKILKKGLKKFQRKYFASKDASPLFTEEGWKLTLRSTGVDILWIAWTWRPTRLAFLENTIKILILPHKLSVLLQYLKNAKLGYKPEAITALNNGILCELMFDIRAQQSDDSRKLLTW